MTRDHIHCTEPDYLDDPQAKGNEMWHETPAGIIKCQAGLVIDKEGAVFHCDVCESEGECDCPRCRTKEKDMTSHAAETVTCPRCHGDGTEPRLASRPCRTCLGAGMVPVLLSEEEMEQLEMDVDVNEKIELHLLGEPRDGEASG